MNMKFSSCKPVPILLWPLLLRPLGTTIEFDDRPVEGITLPSLEDFASHCCGRLLESPEE